MSLWNQWIPTLIRPLPPELADGHFKMNNNDIILSSSVYLRFMKSGVIVVFINEETGSENA